MRIKRRHLIIAGGSLAALSLLLLAPWQSEQMQRVAILHVATPFADAFLSGLRERGYEEGRNLVVDRITTEGPIERFPAEAAQMIARRPDLIVTAGSEFVLNAIERAAPSTPVVMLFIDFDPVASRHVASLAHPGGNVTGVYLQHTDLAAKRLQLLQEAVPSIRRVAVLFDTFTREQKDLAQDAAKDLGVDMLPLEVQGNVYDYGGALDDAVRQKADAVLILSSGEFFRDRFAIMKAINAHQLPSMATTPLADAGPLLCYGPDFPKMYFLAAKYGDQILKGRKPADLAIEQPTTYQLIVNLKTAAALGIAVPETLQRRVDEVVR